MHPRHIIRRAAVILCGVLTLGAAPRHIELETSTPAAGEQIEEMPPALQLTFSGFIEPGYTSVTLTAPDGRSVATGRISFLDGSDRAFTVDVPPVTMPGTYTVDWRTAGADGHVLRGSYSFTLRGDTAAMDAASADPAAAGPAGAPSDPADEHEVHAGGDHDHGGTSRSDGVAAVLARLLHFTALTLLIGGLTFRAVLMPRLDTADTGRAAMKRGAWRAVAFAAVALGTAFVLRLWLQSVALHGADRAWSGPLLSMMLTDTSWGRAWVVQAFLFVVLGAGIVIARPPRDRAALIIAVAAALGLAAMPALSGHAAGASGSAYLAVVNDAVHVVAAGAWLGTLLMLMTVAVPVLRRAPRNGGTPADADAAAGRAAAAVHAFSPIALAGAAVVVATGTINSLMHLNAFAELLTTTYGRVLLAKICIVGFVLLAGLVNWKVVAPRLHTMSGIRRFRRSAAIELALAGLVLTATALLTGLPRP